MAGVVFVVVDAAVLVEVVDGAEVGVEGFRLMDGRMKGTRLNKGKGEIRHDIGKIEMFPCFFFFRMEFSWACFIFFYIFFFGSFV